MAYYIRWHECVSVCVIFTCLFIVAGNVMRISPIGVLFFSKPISNIRKYSAYKYKMNDIPNVDIDTGKFKYILIKVTDQDRSKYIVRGYRWAGYHGKVKKKQKKSFILLFIF